MHDSLTLLYEAQSIVTTPTRLIVNIAAAAVANTVHWTVPQNLFRKPETHAHLEEHMTFRTFGLHGIQRMQQDLAAAQAEPHLNMAVIISQVRERTPIQIAGIVAVFRNW